MTETANKSTSNLDIALRDVRRYLMEKGNYFDRGPAYEGNGKVLSGVRQAIHLYEGMGYTKLMEFGDPPVYGVLGRGHREVHIFQIQDPKIREWLENVESGSATLKDPAMRAYMLEKSGLKENDLAVAANPRQYHINEVDGVFIASTDDIDGSSN